MQEKSRQKILIKLRVFWKKWPNSLLKIKLMIIKSKTLCYKKLLIGVTLMEPTIWPLLEISTIHNIVVAVGRLLEQVVFKIE